MRYENQEDGNDVVDQFTESVVSHILC